MKKNLKKGQPEPSDHSDSDRRTFLKMFMGSAGLTVLPVTISAKVPVGSPGKVTLLTDNGKLVEVSRDILDKFRTGQKASDPDIHHFLERKDDEGARG